MNFLKFTGNTKTNDTFLNNIKSISKDYQSLLTNLKSLNIFESLNFEKNKLLISESSNSFKMRINSKGTKSVFANFPNLLGNAESFSLNFQGLNDFTAQLGKPFIFNKNIILTKLAVKIENKKLNDKKIEVKNLEISSKFDRFNLKIGMDRFQQLNLVYSKLIHSFLGMKIESKIGLISTSNLNASKDNSQNSSNNKLQKPIPFGKFVLSKKLALIGDKLFFESNLKIGKIIGRTPLIEKFLLGDSCRGYQKESIGPVHQNKKIGGNSFIEIKNKAGVFIKNLEIFGFGDLAVNSSKGLKECGEILTSFGDNVCIGKSIGFGCGFKNQKGPSFIFALPLTSNPENEKYSFGIDFEY
jgi:hypothetical protein